MGIEFCFGQIIVLGLIGFAIYIMYAIISTHKIVTALQIEISELKDQIQEIKNQYPSLRKTIEQIDSAEAFTCAKCGAKITPQDKVCPGCGENLDNVPTG